MYSKNARPLKNSSGILNISLNEMPLASEINEQNHILTAISYESLVGHIHISFNILFIFIIIWSLICVDVVFLLDLMQEIILKRSHV